MKRTLLTVARATLLALVLAGASIVIAAEPAGAHGLGGLQPTNYESRLLRVEPGVRGIELRVLDLGTRLQVSNRTARDVTVLGYQGEPYLRVGPHGAFENTRSPATYLNRSTTITKPAPKSADPSARPVWNKLSSGHTVQWHDHRAHFMGTREPPVVQRDPRQRRVLERWNVVMLQGDRTITATGEIVWVPPPSPWPFVIVALVLAVAVFAAGRTSAWRWVIGAALGTIVVAEALHVIGLWGASSAAAGTKLVGSAYSLGGIALAVLAFIWMARRGPHAAVPLILVAAIVLVVAGGLADVTTLGRSQIPTTFSPGFARVLVTLTLGVGAGLAASGGARLRTSPPNRPRDRQPERAKTPVTS
jgi:hypothetical protein